MQQMKRSVLYPSREQRGPHANAKNMDQAPSYSVTRLTAQFCIPCFERISRIGIVMLHSLKHSIDQILTRMKIDLSIHLIGV